MQLTAWKGISMVDDTEIKYKLQTYSGISEIA